MARSLHVLTLPMAIYVDDCALMGSCQEQVDDEMLSFHAWAEAVCGVCFKVIKDRAAAKVQLALGFWWDSTTLTRELDERKLLNYLELLAEYASRPTLTLREMQSVAGRMQRCIMTFPPGSAWMLVPLFALMARLKLPHHRRRTTREVRSNFAYCSTMLKAAMGRGYYSFANFTRAPSVWTDASQSSWRGIRVRLWAVRLLAIWVPSGTQVDRLPRGGHRGCGVPAVGPVLVGMHCDYFLRQQGISAVRGQGAQPGCTAQRPGQGAFLADGPLPVRDRLAVDLDPRQRQRRPCVARPRGQFLEVGVRDRVLVTRH